MGAIENKRKSNRRTKLYNENPFCPDCNVKMILPEQIGFIELKSGIRKLKYTPDNLCTIEHKYTVNNPKRTTPNYTNEERWSILCKKCNKLRGIQCEFNKKKFEIVKIKQQTIHNYYIIKIPTIKIPKIGFMVNKLRLGLINNLRNVNNLKNTCTYQN